MAKAAGGSSRKIGRKSKKPAQQKYRGENRAEKNRKKRIARAEALAARPLSEISNNAKTKRDTRIRAKMVAKGEMSRTRWGSSAGQRQFGSEAKPHHRAQHENSRRFLAELRRKVERSRESQGFVIATK